MELVHDVVDWMLTWAITPYAVFALFVFAFWESSFFLALLVLGFVAVQYAGECLARRKAVPEESQVAE